MYYSAWNAKRKSQKLKYGNKKTEHAGYSFGSKLEAAGFDLLKLKELAGEIKILNVQDRVSLTNANIIYIADFKCLDIATNKEYWVEIKGFETDVWRIKRRLWMHYGPGRLIVYKGNKHGLFIDEEILPK